MNIVRKYRRQSIIPYVYPGSYLKIKGWGQSKADTLVQAIFVEQECTLKDKCYHDRCETYGMRILATNLQGTFMDKLCDHVIVRAVEMRMNPEPRHLIDKNHLENLRLFNDFGEECQ